MMLILLTGNNYSSYFCEIIKFNLVLIQSVPLYVLIKHTENATSRKLEFVLSKRTYIRSMNYKFLYNAPWAIDVFSSMSI